MGLLSTGPTPSSLDYSVNNSLILYITFFQMRRMFYYLMIIFGISLASLVPNEASEDISDVPLASVFSYDAIWHLLVSNFWHFGILDIFGILVS